MRAFLSVAAMFMVAIPSVPATASDQDWATASTVGEIALVTAAVGGPLVADGDTRGSLQAIGSSGAAALITYGLKQTIHEQRPDGSGDDSFPSGHTSVSFAAAASIQNRYGWEYGLPAHLVAAFVGFGRVEAHKHHVHDVLVGAAIGEAAGWLITTKRDSDVQLFPWGDTHSAGMTLSARF